MNNAFKIIFSLGVNHSFFKNGMYLGLTFSPTLAAQNMFTKYGFTINSTVNGFGLYSSSNTAVSDYLAYISKASGINYFDFLIQNNDAAFYTFTEMPLDQLVQFSYSSNNTIQQTGSETLELKATFSNQTSPPLFGTLRIYFSDIPNGAVSLSTNTFQISFVARATQWRYYVINKSSATLSNPSITGKPLVNFQGPDQTVIQSGEQALLFTSGEQFLSMSEEPVYKFDLINKSNQSNSQTGKSLSPKVLFKGLPNPSPSRVGVELINGKNMATSSMYVYV